MDFEPNLCLPSSSISAIVPTRRVRSPQRSDDELQRYIFRLLVMLGSGPKTPLLFIITQLRTTWRRLLCQVVAPEAFSVQIADPALNVFALAPKYIDGRVEIVAREF